MLWSGDIGLKTPFSYIASTVFAIAFSPFAFDYTFIVCFVKAKLSLFRKKRLDKLYGFWYITAIPWIFHINSEEKSNGIILASQIHLNLVFGFTALENSENAFFLRNQGKGVFCFYTDAIPVVYDTKVPGHETVKFLYIKIYDCFDTKTKCSATPSGLFLMNNI